MIYGLDDIRQGFDVSADAVVVGSGAGGAVAAANLAAAGLDTVVLEAGPEIRPGEMTRDAPAFMSKYFWEGGLRQIGGTAQLPSLAGRCLGGGTVVNSAIMLKIPDWVRDEWIDEEGLDHLKGQALDRAFERVFERTHTTATPEAVLGRRNELARDALAAAGIPGAPLPRAVKDCHGCGDCMTGCFDGYKQSVDRCYLPQARADGAAIYTCSQVDRVLMDGTRTTGVSGHVVDPEGRRQVATFAVHAPIVVVAAGVLATPVILLRSGINARGRVGGSLYCHIGGGVVGIMDERVDPWIGASQGFGAIHPDIRGMKLESLWAPASVLAIRWGGEGTDFLGRVRDLARMTVVAVIYRARVRGRVKARRDGLPAAKIWVPRQETHVVLRGVKQIADGLLDIGAEYTNTGVFGVPEELRNKRDTELLLNPKLGPKNAPMTANHLFGSCPMSADSRRGVVDLNGEVYGLDGLFICDGSVCPSPTAVNPQATIMAMAELISRGIAELAP